MPEPQASTHRRLPSAPLTPCHRVRCDRKHPCSACSIRGLGSSCTYADVHPRATAPRSQLRGGASLAPLHDRIIQLEGLVRGLLHQQLDASPAASDSHAPPCESELARRHGPDPLRRDREGIRSDASAQVAPTRVTGRRASPTPSHRSSPGSVTIRNSGAGFVSRAHWKALLDSIAGLREHIDDAEAEVESSVQSPASSINVEHESQPPIPLLFYPYHLRSSPASSPSSIIDSIPNRPVVDRLVTLYFNEIDIATGKLSRNGLPYLIHTASAAHCVFTE